MLFEAGRGWGVRRRRGRVVGVVGAGRSWLVRRWPGCVPAVDAAGGGRLLDFFTLLPLRRDTADLDPLRDGFFEGAIVFVVD